MERIEATGDRVTCALVVLVRMRITSRRRAVHQKLSVNVLADTCLLRRMVDERVNFLLVPSWIRLPMAILLNSHATASSTELVAFAATAATNWLDPASVYVRKTVPGPARKPFVRCAAVALFRLQRTEKLNALRIAMSSIASARSAAMLVLPWSDPAKEFVCPLVTGTVFPPFANVNNSTFIWSFF